MRIRGEDVRLTLRSPCLRCRGLGFVPCPDGSSRSREPIGGGWIHGEGQLCGLCLGACYFPVIVFGRSFALSYEEPLDAES